MADWIVPADCDASSYRGLEKIFEFTNEDGDLTPTNCGLAASATYLTYRGIFPPAPESAHGIMRSLEVEHPPDIFFGKFGTSRSRVQRMCKAHGVEMDFIEGEDALRSQLDTKKPVVVMCQMPGRELLGLHFPTGHWMVAYGYDRDRIFLSNYGTMAWQEFRDVWEGIIPGLIGMTNLGLIAKE